LTRLAAIALLAVSGAAFADSSIFVNEIHYDNAGADANEGIEIAGPAGTDLTGWQVVPYNGNGGASYSPITLSGTLPASCGGYGVVAVPIPGMQNGAPDGVALVDGAGNVVQFLSYEGVFTATDGPASGLSSTDIGVAEDGTDAATDSLQLAGTGTQYEDFAWQPATPASFGACNAGQTFVVPATPPFINEIHYENSGTDANEGVEIAGPAGTDLTGWQVVPYNGNGGASYSPITLSGTLPASCGSYGVMAVPIPGMQNGAPDGVALVDDAGNVVQFLSYEGVFVASDGPASGLSSTDIGVAETGSSAATDSLQLVGMGTQYGDFAWQTDAPASFGTCNVGQTFAGSDTPPTVASTVPANNATDVALGATIDVTFSEPVGLTQPGAFGLACESSGTHTFQVSGTGADYTIDPEANFAALESCSLTIHAADVHDLDGDADAMPADVVVVFTTGSDSGDYYAGVDTSSGPALEAWLHNRIKDHVAYPYTSSTTDTWDILRMADEDPMNPDNVVDVYKNVSYPKTSSSLNREHTWPNSYGFNDVETVNGHPYPPYTDTHMLYMADSSYNQSRGNNPYGDCAGTGTCTEKPTVLTNGFGGPGFSNYRSSAVWQVWSHREGDVARAVMYAAVRYDGGINAMGQPEPDLILTDNVSLIQVTPSGATVATAYMGFESDILEWNDLDPPDAQERLRNEVVYSYQHNRNPFIDHPEWAHCVFTNTDCPGSDSLFQNGFDE
jgi:endonuclease I